MLKKSERMRRDAFQGRARSRLHFRYGSIVVLAHSPARAAVVVSKKTCPKAVERARLKRRVYAILRDLIRKGLITKSIAVYPTRAALSATPRALKESLASPWR